MLPSALDTFSFYFNYDYGRHNNSTPDVNGNEAYVKHIVDSFYKLNFGKIVKVHDMISECGRFFIISFNKETGGIQIYLEHSFKMSSGRLSIRAFICCLLRLSIKL